MTHKVRTGRRILADLLSALSLVGACVIVVSIDQGDWAGPRNDNQTLLVRGAARQADNDVDPSPMTAKTSSKRPPKTTGDHDPVTDQEEPRVSRIDPQASGEDPVRPDPVRPDPVRPDPVRDPVDPVREDPQRAVEFFETKGEAESVAYIVDCSGSMGGRRFRRTSMELARSINALTLEQEFYVAFFNSKAVPMFDVNAPTGLSTASDEMKADVRAWMNKVNAGGGTNPEPALQLAAPLKPDVIYLLSDGQFSALSPAMQELLRQNQIVVHTIAFESQGGAVRLKQIAESTGGTFRFVPVRNISPADELILQLGSGAPPVRQRARRELIKLADGLDHGPSLGATAQERVEAIAKWTEWADLEKKVREYVRLGEAAIVSAFQHPNAIERRAAVIAARQEGMDRAEQLIELLRDADASVRQEARQALVQLADGLDFGPDEGAAAAEQGDAVVMWRGWLARRKMVHTFRHGPTSKLLKALTGSDVDTRWAALVAAAERRADAPGHFIPLLNEPHAEVRQAARQALVRLTDGEDFGPDEPANAAEIDDAVALWSEWSKKKKEAQAERQLRLAVQLLKQGRVEVGRKRLRDIVRKFPGTNAANAAKGRLAN